MAPGRVTVQPTDVRATPGGPPVRIHVDVFNTGSIVDDFWAGAFQAPAWLSGQPKMISLYPGRHGSVDLEFSIAGTQVVAASVYPLTIRVVAATPKEIVCDQQIRLQVATIAGSAAIKLEPQQVWGVHGASLDVAISQTGNAPVSAVLSGEDPAGALHFQFYPPTVTVPPAGMARSGCVISARAPLLGEALDHRFTVGVQGFSQPLQASGVFNQSPVVSPGRLRLLSIALESIGGILVLVGALVLPWTTGGSGLYQGSVGGLGWGYMRLAQVFYRVDVQFSQGEQFLDARWLSGGSILIVLAVLTVASAILGRRRLARISAALIVVLMLGFLLTILFAPAPVGSISSGALVALLGGVLALFGSLFVKPLRRSTKIRQPKGVPMTPRLP